MFVSLAKTRWICAGGLALLLGGCYPLEPASREDDHPLINEAMSRKSASPREAAKLLEKAIETNPRLARAHWELGLICLNNTSNYAAAVYHFQKVLALRPDWPHASTARQLISNSQLELVKEGVEAPTLPSVQRQMDRLVEELHRLTALKTNLQAQVQYLSGVTQQLAAENLQLRQSFLAVNRSTPAPGALVPEAPLASDRLASPVKAQRPPPAAAVPTGDARPRSGSTRPTVVGASGTVIGQLPATGNATRVAPRGGLRTYTVRRGETAFAICRRYGLTVQDLVAANPSLNPAGLKAGQTINLPSR